MSATVFYNAAAEQAVLSNTFTVGGTPADPTTVTLTVTDPAGVQTSPAPSRLSAGSYTATVSCASVVEGIWTYVWTGTGTASDVIAGTWTTSTTNLSRYYCGSDELKSRLRIASSDDDSEILLAIGAASRAVDGYCERYFYRATDTRTYVPGSLYETKVDDLVSVTALATDPAGTTAQGGTFPVSWAASDFQLLPYNPGRPGEPWPFTKIRAVGTKTFPWVVPMILMRADRVQVTGVFGWPAVPQAVRTATLITAAELFKLKDAPLGVAGGDDLALAAIGSSPRIGELLTPYVRNPFLAA